MSQTGTKRIEKPQLVCKFNLSQHVWEYVYSQSEWILTLVYSFKLRVHLINEICVK